MPFDPLSTVPVELLADGRLRVLADVTWTGLYGDTVLIPAGTVSDLASVPWVVRAVIARDGKIARAALVHDVLCDALNAYDDALAAWQRQERANEAAARAGRGQVVVQGPAPTPPPFTAVQADGVFWLVARELGVPPVTARLYWTGTRYGSMFSRHAVRRAGWWRTLPGVVWWSAVALLVLPPAAVGALASGLLLALAEVLAWPFARRPVWRAGDARTPARRPALRRPRPLELPDRTDAAADLVRGAP